MKDNLREVDLFGPPFVARPTSEAAARSIKPHVSRLQGIVLAAIKEAMKWEGYNGATDWEISEISTLAENTVRPRRIELLRKGLIEEAGTRETRSGRKAVVWRIK